MWHFIVCAHTIRCFELGSSEFVAQKVHFFPQKPAKSARLQFLLHFRHKALHDHNESFNLQSEKDKSGRANP